MSVYQEISISVKWTKSGCYLAWNHVEWPWKILKTNQERSICAHRFLIVMKFTFPTRKTNSEFIIYFSGTYSSKRFVTATYSAWAGLCAPGFLSGPFARRSLLVSSSLCLPTGIPLCLAVTVFCYHVQCFIIFRIGTSSQCNIMWNSQEKVCVIKYMGRGGLKK